MYKYAHTVQPKRFFTVAKKAERGGLVTRLMRGGFKSKFQGGCLK